MSHIATAIVSDHLLSTCSLDLGQNREVSHRLVLSVVRNGDFQNLVAIGVVGIADLRIILAEIGKVGVKLPSDGALSSVNWNISTLDLIVSLVVGIVKEVAQSKMRVDTRIHSRIDNFLRDRSFRGNLELVNLPNRIRIGLFSIAVNHRSVNHELVESSSTSIAGENLEIIVSLS